ncbi:hypothetical protein IWX90DRAFT_145002 [Phyllosticta citrichinensis]|uniref:Secreted protein n=1 Tax=Phyllosticta citrichinensis TaxID=1130410 RepID=A0ABR1XZ15_9PEZI
MPRRSRLYPSQLRLLSWPILLLSEYQVSISMAHGWPLLLPWPCEMRLTLVRCLFGQDQEATPHDHPATTIALHFNGSKSNIPRSEATRATCPGLKNRERMAHHCCCEEHNPPSSPPPWPNPQPCTTQATSNPHKDAVYRAQWRSPCSSPKRAVVSIPDQPTWCAPR